MYHSALSEAKAPNRRDEKYKKKVTYCQEINYDYHICCIRVKFIKVTAHVNVTCNRGGPPLH